MRSLRARDLVLVAGVMLAVGWLLAVASCQTESAPQQVSDEQVLRCLPLNAQIAQIPSVFDDRRSEVETRRGVLFGDTDGDGHDEVIVAYYTPPSDFWVQTEAGKQVQPGFTMRAHVRVLKWEDGSLREQWDSGGGGMEFRAGLPDCLVQADPDTQRAWTRSLFDVRDITGDGVPELLFTRTFDEADGTRFEAWAWAHVCYYAIAHTDGFVRVEQGKIMPVFDEKQFPLDKPAGLVWDGKHFVSEDVVQKDDK